MLGAPEEDLDAGHGAVRDRHRSHRVRPERPLQRARHVVEVPQPHNGPRYRSVPMHVHKSRGCMDIGYGGYDKHK